MTSECNPHAESPRRKSGPPSQKQYRYNLDHRVNPSHDSWLPRDDPSRSRTPSGSSAGSESELDTSGVSEGGGTTQGGQGGNTSAALVQRRTPGTLDSVRSGENFYFRISDDGV